MRESGKYSKSEKEFSVLLARRGICGGLAREMRKIEKMWVWKMDRGVGGGEIQVENGKQKRDGMKLWEFAFEEKNFLLFDSVRVSRGLGG